MLFNSYVFCLFFLPATLVGYYVLNKFKKYNISKIYLISMSLWFYAYFNYSYAFIILTSILFNFVLGKFFYRPIDAIIRKLLLILGLAVNLGALFYFKYYDFFISNLNAVFQKDFNLIHIVLPLGISFFTFQQLSFLIDCYWNKVPNYNFIDYAIFVSFFPQLVAGPIVLHNEIIPQFNNHNKKNVDFLNLSKGIMAFSFGMAKKVLVADTFGNAVNWGFSNLTNLDSTNAILIMLAYTFQIYFDFSGYCDIATGIGLMFNIEITQNFNSPYKALTIQDFWKRWHITLTRFFTSYIYIPLGGNRKGAFRTYCNMFFVFFLSGIWHGANWTFILWGIVHGLAVVLNRIFKKQIDSLHPALSWIMTFGFINLAWVYFRAPSITVATNFIKTIAKFNFGSINDQLISSVILPEVLFIKNLFFSQSPYFNVLFLMGCFFATLYAILGMKNTNERIDNFHPNFFQAIVTAILLVWSVVSFSGVSTFLYFNF